MTEPLYSDCACAGCPAIVRAPSPELCTACADAGCIPHWQTEDADAPMNPDLDYRCKVPGVSDAFDRSIARFLKEG